MRRMGNEIWNKKLLLRNAILYLLQVNSKLRKDKRGKVLEGDYMNYNVNQRLNEMIWDQWILCTTHLYLHFSRVYGKVSVSLKNIYCFKVASHPPLIFCVVMPVLQADCVPLVIKINGKYIISKNELMFSVLFLTANCNGQIK